MDNWVDSTAPSESTDFILHSTAQLLVDKLFSDDNYPIYLMRKTRNFSCLFT